jgi:hypothetical protein
LSSTNWRHYDRRPTRASAIEARDGTRDRIDCGPGRHILYADAVDRLRRCEIVRRG